MTSPPPAKGCTSCGILWGLHTDPENRKKFRVIDEQPALQTEDLALCGSCLERLMHWLALDKTPIAPEEREAMRRYRNHLERKEPCPFSRS